MKTNFSYPTTRPDRHPSVRRADGFSAIELMVALVIMGVILAMGLPSFSSSLGAHRINSDAGALASQMQLARGKAIAENIPHIVSWSASTEQYFVVQDSNQDGIPNWGTEATSGPFELSDGIDLNNCTSGGFTTNQIIFFPDGSASETGCLELTNAKGGVMQLSVLQPSGVVDVQAN